MKMVTTVLLITIVGLSCTHSVQQQLLRSSESIGTDVPKTLLFVPIESIESVYLDNTTIFPEIELSDSFYCEAANSFLLFECSRKFTVKDTYLAQGSDNLKRWTSFSNDTTGKDLAVASIRKLTEQAGVEYILIPFSCAIKQSAVQQDGWRQGKYGGAYDRPVAYKSSVTLHVQLWDKQGALLFEKRATGSSGRPILYDAIKNRSKKTSTDIINYSKRLFSPPLLRALNQAVRSVMALYR